MEVSIQELFQDEKYHKYISQNEINFFETFGRLNNKKRLIEKLKRVYDHVETFGRGSNLTFELANPIHDAVIDKRSIATTDPAVLELAQLVNEKIGKDRIGDTYTAKNWLRKFGFKLFFEADWLVREEFNKLTADLDLTWNEYSKSEIVIQNYKKPSILKVLADSKADAVIFDQFYKFYGRFFAAVVNHSKLKFEDIWLGLNEERNEISYLLPHEVVAMKKFELENRELSKKRNWKETVEYLDFIKSRFDADRVWKEYKLKDASIDKSVQINEGEENNIFDLTTNMFIKSMTRRELSKKRRPYSRSEETTKNSESMKVLADLGLVDLDSIDLTDDEFKVTDSIEFRLIKDRVLVEAIVKIIELINKGYKVDMSFYFEKLEEEKRKNDD